MVDNQVFKVKLLGIVFIIIYNGLFAQNNIPTEQLTGRYEFENGMAIQFKSKGSILFLVTPGNPVQEMKPTGNNTYRSKTLADDEFVFSTSKPNVIRVTINNSFGSLTGILKSKDVIDNTETMDSLITLRKKSAHFEYWYNEADKALIDSLSTYLESSYQRILKDFNLASLPITIVKIYPDLKSFHIAINQPNSSAEILATAFGKNEFRMVSPAKGGPDMMKYISHEFTHCVHLNIDYSPNNPRWLWEGLAMFESGWFMDPGGIDEIKSKTLSTLHELSNGMEYMLGYVVIEAIKDLYGFDKVIQLVKARGDTQKVFNLSEKDFSKMVFDEINRKYIK